MNKTFCEFFAGIGLVREGLAGSGWECVFANDVDPKKLELYEGKFGPEQSFHLGDVWDTEDVLARMPEQFFLATASFPCVDLSLAGRGRGFDGEHSSTFFGFVKILEAMGERRPKVIMLENVTGFITSREGGDFEAAVRALAELGYWIDAFILDARFFVPQSRPRVFLIGLHQSVSTPLGVRKNSDDWLLDEWNRVVESAEKSLRPKKLLERIRSIVLPTGWLAFRIPIPKTPTARLELLIDQDDNQAWWDEEAISKHYHMMSDLHRERVDQALASRERLVGTIFRRKRDGKTRAEVRFDGIAGCLRTPRGGSARQIVAAIDAGSLRMRWMSPREYARLQGAGDYPLVGNAIQNLYGFGDAVCVPVVRWIDEHVLTPVFDECLSKRGTNRAGQSDPGTTTKDNAGSQRNGHVAREADGRGVS